MPSKVVGVALLRCCALGLALAILPGAAISGGSVTALDLRSDFSIRIVGAGRVASAGDINGDDIPDALVSVGDIAWEPTRGRTWVIFGQATEKTIHLDDLGDDGFVIEGADEDDYASHAVGVGDVNGDGLDDVLIGAPGATPDDTRGRGIAYVVFGKTDTDSVNLLLWDLELQMERGFSIEGPSDHSFTGEDVDRVGDMNGDGLADLLIGAPFAGATYVVWGKADSSRVDLNVLYTEGNPLGFVVRTASPSRSSSYSVGGAGDVNGDSIPDIVIGVIPHLAGTGSAYVIFGKTNSSMIRVKNLGNHGFAIEGSRRRALLGSSSAGAGDVNGDGFDDVIVGAPWSSQAFVIFGKRTRSPVHLARIGPSGNGFRIKGTPIPGDDTGSDVAPAGDINGDGLADVLVGAKHSGFRGRSASGSAYVVFGKRGTTPVRLSRLRRGYRIDGARRNDKAGTSVAGIGDMNGDGVPDVIVGAPLAGKLTGAEKRNNQGKSYILWGR